MKISIVPVGFQTTLYNCPVGLFLFNETLCLKTEYGDDVYIAESGEAFWGGTKSKEERARLLVIPCAAKITK